MSEKCWHYCSFCCPFERVCTEDVLLMCMACTTVATSPTPSAFNTSTVNLAKKKTIGCLSLQLQAVLLILSKGPHARRHKFDRHVPSMKQRKHPEAKILASASCCSDTCHPHAPGCLYQTSLSITTSSPRLTAPSMQQPSYPSESNKTAPLALRTILHQTPWAPSCTVVCLPDYQPAQNTAALPE